MGKYTQYDELLRHYISFVKGVGIFVVVILVGLFLLCVAMKYKKIAIVILVVSILILSLMYFLCIYPYEKDINEKAYVTYTGNFYVEECFFVNRGGSYILLKYEESNNSIRYKVLCDVSSIENNTEYVGTIVYSQNSKCLIDIQLT